MREECCTCSDRLNYVKLCEKYDQLESIHKVLVEDNLTYENQISDLETKLAESEKNVEFYQERYSDATTSAYGADLIAKNIQSRLEEEIRKLKQQLAEKEKENELMTATLRMTKFIEKEVAQDKISFAVERLEKVKEWTHDNASYVLGDFASVWEDALLDELDNQIKQLKEMK